MKKRRSDRFRQTLAEKLGHADAASWHGALEELKHELGLSISDLAAGMLALLAEQQGLNAKLPPAPAPVPVAAERRERSDSPRSERGERTERAPRRERNEGPMDRYRIAVGRVHDVRVSDVVGAIANEAGIDSANIGRIQLFDDYTTVDLPQGMPKDVLQHLKTVRVRGHMMNIAPASGGEGSAPRKRSHYGDSSAPRAREQRETRKPREDGAAPRKRLALKH